MFTFVTYRWFVRMRYWMNSEWYLLSCRRYFIICASLTAFHCRVKSYLSSYLSRISQHITDLFRNWTLDIAERMIDVILVFNYELQGQAVHCFVNSYLDDQSKTAYHGYLIRDWTWRSSLDIAENDRCNPCLELWVTRASSSLFCKQLSRRSVKNIISRT